MLHHYTEFMERDLIADADEHVAQLIADYRALLDNTYTDPTEARVGVLADARIPPLLDINKIFPAF